MLPILKIARNSQQFLKCSRLLSTETLSVPAPDGVKAPLSPKIEKLVDDITRLTLLEVSELSTALKHTLNLPDMPAMSFGALSQATPVEEDIAPKITKTSYTLKLMKFDDTKKVALIKEIKGLLEDMNLVQAKKFVESAPTIVKGDLGKEEAEKLKESLEKVGAVCVID